MANEQAKRAVLKASAKNSVKSNARLVAKLRRSGYLELEDALGKLVQEAQAANNPEVVKNLQAAHALARQIIAPMVRAIRALEAGE